MPSTRKRAPARTKAKAKGRSTAARNTRARANTRRSARGRGRGGASNGLFSFLPRGLQGFALDQRARDVIGLALVAVGVFMGFILYGNWDGGNAGHGLAVAFGWILGRARVLAPIALIAAGLTLLLREMIPMRRSLLRDPRAIGAICLFAAATLALAAGTFGVSHGAGTSETAWTSASTSSSSSSCSSARSS